MNHDEIIARLSLILTADEDHESQMNRALSLIGTEMGISRSYIVVYSPDGNTASHFHEWRAEGVPSGREAVEVLPIGDLPGREALDERGEFAAIDDAVNLSQNARSALDARGIRSFVMAPLMNKGRLNGFIGFDECAEVRRWSEDEKTILLDAVRILKSAYSKAILTERLSASEENFKTFFDTIDDIIIIGDEAGNVLFANGGACRSLGYSLDELRAMKILDLHPADKQAEALAILQAMYGGSRDSCPLELLSSTGERVPVETRIWFGKWNGKRALFGLSKNLSAEQAALQKFERLFRNNPAAMAISRREDRVFLDVNDAFERIFGFTRNEIIGSSGRDLSIFVNEESWLDVREELMQGKSIQNIELTLRKKDGSFIQGLFSGDVINSQGESYFLTVMIDITEQTRLRKDLEDERRRLENIIWGTGLGTWEWNVQTGETVFNDQWAAIAGYTLEELGPISIETWAALVHPDDLAESNRLLVEHFEGKSESYDFEGRMRRKVGGWVWVHDRGKVVERDGGGKPLWMYGTHADITRQHEMQERIRELAVRDPLTGIYNRRYLLDQFAPALAECARGKNVLSLAILDIDHFKAINDTWGHLAGDLVLKEFCGIVASMVRSYDLVGRFGGEEFIILSRGTRKDELLAMIERIMNRVRAAVFTHDGQEIRCTFSAGLAECTEIKLESLSVETLIALVDERMYAAKAAGRDRCVWE